MVGSSINNMSMSCELGRGILVLLLCHFVAEGTSSLSGPHDSDCNRVDMLLAFGTLSSSSFIYSKRKSLRRALQGMLGAYDELKSARTEAVLIKVKNTCTAVKAKQSKWLHVLCAK